MKTIATFPNGFSNQATIFFRTMQWYGFAPSWEPGTDERGYPQSNVQIPDDQVEAFRTMQRVKPELFGNPPAESK